MSIAPADPVAFDISSVNVRVSTVIQLEEAVNAAGGNVNVLDPTASYDHMTLTVRLNEVANAVNGMGANPPLPIYNDIDYTNFSVVVNNIILAMEGISPGPAREWKLIGSTLINGSGNYSPPIDTTGADLLVIVVSSTYSLTTSPIDSYDNTWTLGVSLEDAQLNYLSLWYSRTTNVGPGHMFNNGDGAYPTTAVAAFSGSSTSPADQMSADASALSAGEITPSQPNALIIAGTGNQDTGTSTITAPFIWLVGEGYIGSISFGAELAYYIQATPAPVDPVWDTSQPTGSLIMSFL